MRSPYEDSAAVSTDNKYHTTSYSYNSNNNNNYHKNFNGNGNVNGNGNGNGIPYHARENSLPFSYGIAKTSTQLRKTPTPTRLDSFLDNDYVLSGSSSSNSSSHNNSNSNNHHNNKNNNNNSASDMIKPQPRLTSPLLVRKTLANTNATSSKANANTSPNPNPNTNTISNTYHYGSAPRADFEQLLRERRDKVYSEYRDREKEREKEREMERTMSRVPPMPPQRRQSHNKYNYDFEFNLNLNDFSNERSSLPAPASASTPYATRNIEYRQDVDVPDGAAVHNARRLESTFVERNYHTINSKSHSLERTPMELTYKQQQQQRQQQQQQQFTTVEPQLEQHSHIYGQNHTRSRRDLSPIYAISAKRAPNSNGQQQQQQQYQQQQQQVDYLLTPSPTSRPETPAFPLTPRTPFSTPGSSVTQRTSPTTTESIYQTIASRQQQQQQQQQLNATPSPTFEVAADLVKFARNSAKFWYKSLLSREDAIALLMNAQPGTFLVRDSTTYKNAYGLVLRVAQPPAGSQELVRHFLIEPTQRGVRLKGCENEPTFTSLSALIYEHSINKLALPCLLRIPDADVVPGLAITTPAQQQLLTHGAATNVLWLFSCDTESLTGNEAIRKAIRLLYEQKPLPLPTEVHFKVSGQGITLTDNTRKKFFRKHYTADVISHCAIDPENRMWSTPEEPDKKTIFAFVARRSHSSKDNQCHVFSDLSVAQPAAAIVSFANRTLPTEKQRNYVL